LINFVSSLPRDLRTGGFSAMNAAAYDALRKVDTINYVGPINPPTIFKQKAMSKLLRMLGSQGDFFAFSRNRLESIAEEVHLRCSTDTWLYFFHGFTPWILTSPPRPYVAWSDCTFHDYITIYHRPELFRVADIQRIERMEAEWLRNARCVAFNNDWAARRSVEHYGLDASCVHSVGAFGEIETPAVDEYAGQKQFVFVSTAFEAKGGLVLLSAFRHVRKRHPDASLVIVGARPKGAVSENNTIFTGYLRKERPEEHARFRAILSGARALVHPTTSDISPLIIVEAGYFGCPTISVRKFAIPALVDHEVTGLLLDDPLDVSALAQRMNWMLEHESAYQVMRRCAWAKARRENSKKAFERKMQALIRTAH
jgi:glycosyltransferase involved in cell wall biosynthesis